MYCTALYHTVHCTALQCIIQHNTALHCTALNCIALHCTALQVVYLWPVQVCGLPLLHIGEGEGRAGGGEGRRGEQAVEDREGEYGRRDQYIG